jgi:hypothetical protein
MAMFVQALTSRRLRFSHRADDTGWIEPSASISNIQNYEDDNFSLYAR